MQVCVGTMETLRGNLEKVLQGSAGLIKRAGSLQCPSWKVPEKLAVSLDVGKVLDEGLSQDQTSSQFFILELIIDR